LNDANIFFVTKAGYSITVARSGKEKRIILDYKVLCKSVNKTRQAMFV